MSGPNSCTIYAETESNMSALNLCGIVLTFIGVASLMLYTLFQWSYTYWRRKGVKGPRPSFPEGNFHGVFSKKKHISDPIGKLYEQYKSEPYIGVYSLYQPVLIVNDLDLIKNILIKDFDYFDSHGIFENEEVDPLSVNLFQLSGERWKDMRTTLSPVFTSGKMKGMTDIMIEVQKRLTENIARRAERDSVINIKETLGLYTMDVIASCGFGIECDSFENPDNNFVKFGNESISPSDFKTKMTFMLSFMAPSVLEWLRMSAQSSRVIDFFGKLVEETVRYREEKNIKRNDLMQQLMELKNDTFKNDNGEVMKPKRKFTSVDLTAQTFLFLIAGYETSSSAASYALYWLAQQPALQQRARDEILSVLVKNNGRWTYEALQQLEYLTMVIEETLRLHPALNFLFRKCTKPYKVANSTLTLEQETRVYIPVIGVHMDPDLYPQPQSFDPERFTKEAKAKRHKSAYMPFGDGPRICIGMRFAMMQVKLALAGVLAAHEVTVCEKTRIPLQLDTSSLVTAPKGGIFLRFRSIK